MMYLLLTLFFASLSSIIFMIGKKLVIIQNEKTTHSEEVLFELPYIKEIKHATIKNAKKHGYAGLVATLRLYVRSSDFIKDKYKKLKEKIEERKNKNSLNGEKQEISKFLKVIGDYKHRIREIKHKIRKEEENN